MDAPRARVARIARVAPHTIHTHTQSHNRRHGSRLGAGRRGWDAAEQRSRGRLGLATTGGTSAGLAPGDAGGAGDGDDGEGGTKKRKRRGAKQSGQAWRRREAARREVPTSDAHGAG